MNLQEQIHKIKKMMGIILEQETIPKPPSFNNPNYVGSDYFSNIGQQYKTKGELNYQNYCLRISASYLDEAKKFWLNWINNPTTKKKFYKNYNGQYNSAEVDDIFNSYLEVINNVKLKGYNDENTDTIMYVNNEETDNIIYVNCFKTININRNEVSETLIHEIQHLMYDRVLPINPNEKIEQSFSKSTSKSNNKNYNDSKSVSKVKNIEIDNQIKNVSKTLNIDKIYLYDILSGAEGQDKEYVYDLNEKMSNIMAIRKLFNLKPEQNITSEMLLPYIKNEKSNINVDWFLFLWASEGFKDLNLVLNNINQLAINYQKSNDYPYA